MSHTITAVNSGGMDMATILAKMKMPYDSMKIKIDANRTDEHPRVYDRIRLSVHSVRR
jgi:uncharacterized OsmC-like protein